MPSFNFKIVIILFFIFTFPNIFLTHSLLISSTPTTDLNLESSQNINLLWTHTTSGGVRQVYVTSDGRYVTAGGRGFITRLDSETGKIVWKLEKPIQVNSMVSTDNGSFTVVGLEEALLLAIKEDGSLYWRKSTDGPVISLALDGGGRRCVFGTFPGSLYFADPVSKELFSTYRREYISTIQVAISEEGSIVAAGYADDSVEVFKWDKPHPLWNTNIEGHAMTIKFTPSGDKLLVGSSSGLLYAFNPTNGIPIWTFRTNATISSIAFVDDTSKVAVGSYNNYVYLLKVESGSQIWSYKSEGAVKSLEYIEKISMIGVGGTDKKFRLLNVSSGSEMDNVKSEFWITSISSSKDGSTAAFGAGKKVYYTQLSYEGGEIQDKNKRIKGEIYYAPIIYGAGITAVSLGIYIIVRRVRLNKRMYVKL